MLPQWYRKPDLGLWYFYYVTPIVPQTRFGVKVLLLHAVLLFDTSEYPRFSDHHHGRVWVQNCPIGQPSLGKWGFFLDLFVLGPRARLKLGVIRSLLETIPAVQSSSNLGKRTIFIFPTIKHNIKLQHYLVKFCTWSRPWWLSDNLG